MPTKKKSIRLSGKQQLNIARLSEAPVLKVDSSNWRQVYQYNYHKLLHCDMLSRSFFCAMFLTVLVTVVKYIQNDRTPLNIGPLTIIGLAWLSWARQSQFAEVMSGLADRIRSGKK